jgi:hypothetical protein
MVYYFKYWSNDCATSYDAPRLVICKSIYNFPFTSVCRMIVIFVKEPSQSFLSWRRFQYFAKRSLLEQLPDNIWEFILWSVGIRLFFYCFTSSVITSYVLSLSTVPFDSQVCLDIIMSSRSFRFLFSLVTTTLIVTAYFPFTFILKRWINAI